MVGPKSKLPILSLLPSLGHPQLFAYPLERDINRSTLIDVAPDREELLSSGKTIEELRQNLKLRVTSPNGHWLYRALTRHEVRLRDATTRLSVFGQFCSETPNENSDENRKATQVIRRALSASSIYAPAGTPLQGIENMLFTSGWPSDSAAGNLETWAGTRLSTTDKLISPRPLGPTHILVVYETSPARIGASRKPPLSPRKAKGFGIFPEVNELPINDLLFLLNVPNLSVTQTGGDGGLLTLPRRLHKELPRVLMYVPHLETFPELVVYLHTKNQAELFRKLIPEWLRDLLHPLPVTVSAPTVRTSTASCPLIETANVFRYLGLLVAGSTSTASADTMNVALLSESLTERTIQSIAEEIAQTMETPVFEEAKDPLVRAATVLNALRDNLQHIGYFKKDLWYELDLSHEILLKAISLNAKLGED